VLSAAPPKQSRRSVRTDIVAGFLALLAALAVVGGYAVYRQSRAATALRLQNQRYLPLSSLLERLYNNQDTMDVLLERAAVTRDPAARSWLQAARRARRRVLARARVSVEAARADAESPQDRALVASLSDEVDTVERVFRESEPRYIELFDATALGDPRASARVYRELGAAEQTALAALRSAARSLEARMSALAVDAANEQRRTLQLLVAATTMALGFGVVMLVSARRALDPLLALRERVRSVAKGDLTEREVVARDDEIGELAREFGNMVEAVRDRDTALREQAEQLRRAERHLEQVVATLRAGVVVVSSAGVVASVNPAASRLVSDATLEGRSIEDGPLGAVAGLAAAVRDVIAGSAGRSFDAVKFGDRSLDGLVVEFVVSGDGRGALVVLDDVTEREQTRSRLLQNERLAAIGRMAAHVTHEVRNPLTSLALNAELLAEELVESKASDDANKLVSAMQREVDRLTSVTEEYLRVARLPQPRLEREDVSVLVKDAANFMKPELERAGVALVVSADEPVFAAVDEGQLRQALLNLLRNAREALQAVTYRAGERPTIRVGVEWVRGGVEVSVEDNGPGLAQEVRERLFELFVSTKEKGTGLGLSLTREIVAAHNGTIVAEVAKHARHGARFVLWIPGAAPSGT
jgi:nitrogen fixation/metabolism regulation signal transduction histidine kinase